MNKQIFVVVLISVLLLSSMLGAKPIEPAVVEAASQAGMNDPDAWPMHGHDPACTSYSPSSAPNTNATAWVSDLPGGTVWASPVVAEGKVFIGTGGNFTAWDENKGSLVWSFRAPKQPGYPGTGAVADGRVFFGTAEPGPTGCIYALNTTTGKQIWNFTTEGYVRAPPVVVEDRLYIGGDLDSTGKIYCINATTGASIWNYTTQDRMTSVAVAYGKVYASCGHWQTATKACIYCLDMYDGSFVWSFDTDRDLSGSLSVANGKVYFAASYEGWDCIVYAVNATNGDVVWSTTRYSNGEAAGRTAVAYGKVFIFLYRGAKGLYALNETNGDEVWALPGPAINGPVVADGKVFFEWGDPYNARWQAVNETTGAVVWSYELGGGVHSSTSAIANGRVFVADHYDPKLYAFGSAVTKFEKFGPRADRLLIKLYESAEAEWEAFATGKLDCTDMNAYSRTYVGPEAPYTGKNWMGVVNIQGYGVDNIWSFMNMHPEGFERGTGDMTIRWGFSTPVINSLNPIYASSSHDWKVLDQIYEPLLARNPSNLDEFLPWTASAYEVGVYEHPTYGTCTKVKFSLRPDVYWSDGTPLTMADVHFTFVELDDILEARGLPPPSWIENVQYILDFRILDPYNFEVLFNHQTDWAVNWTGLNWILPKHIWKPIVTTGDPTTFAPDPNMIGSGPWRFVEHVENSHIVFVANTPGSTITTNLPGSTLITSPKGYWRYLPITYRLTVDGATMARIDRSIGHTINLTLTNEWYGGPITIDINMTVTYPDRTEGYTYTDIVLNAFGQPESEWNLKDYLDQNITSNIIHLEVKSPPELAGQYHSTLCLWATIKADIDGSTLYDDVGLSTYPYKEELPAPDIMVNIRDITLGAMAFGTIPGHTRWNPVADVTGDYRVDIRDIAAIAMKFGWSG